MPPGITFLLPSQRQEFGIEKAASLSLRASLTLLVLDVHRSNEWARGGWDLPSHQCPGRRAGAHVSPAICKSTDTIRAVVEGITEHLPAKSPGALPGEMTGWYCWRGVHLVLTLTLSPGQDNGVCAAVPCAVGTA